MLTLCFDQLYLSARWIVVTACYPPGILGDLQTHFSAELTPNLKEDLWRYKTNALTQHAI